MNKANIYFNDSQNLITIRNVSENLNHIVEKLGNKAFIVSCNIKPTDKTDILICVEDEKLYSTVVLLAKETSGKCPISIRSGICKLSLVNFCSSPATLTEWLINYFQNNGIVFERLLASEKEIQIFFPAGEVCGCLDKFISKLELHLHSYKLN